MALPFFSRLFSKSDIKQNNTDSLLLQNIKNIAQANNLYFFENMDIFHDEQCMRVPLMLVDPKRGIYLFEYKTWDYDDLKNAYIAKASNQTASKNTLAFDALHHYIQTRFQIVANYDDMEIFHFAIMPNLTMKEYKSLDSSLQALLPSKQIIFSSSTQEQIYNLLAEVCNTKEKMPSTEVLLSTLFIQMLVMKDDGTIALPSKEQAEIINDTSKGISYISSENGAGKSTTIVLKALFEHLKSPKLNITIVEPTLLASELLKKKFVDILEYSNIEVHFTKFKIITPDNIKNFKSDILFIDDFDSINLFHINLKTAAKRTYVFEPYNKEHQYGHTLQKNYIGECKVSILTDDIYLSTFLKIAEILQLGANPNDIIIVSTSDEVNHKILEDLPNFVDDTPVHLDKRKGLHAQALEHIIVAKPDALHGLSRDFVIAANPINIEKKVVNFIYSRAKKQIYVIYNK